MTFEQWFDDMQDRYDANYSGYEDLLKECWEAAGSQLTKETE